MEIRKYRLLSIAVFACLSYTTAIAQSSEQRTTYELPFSEQVWQSCLIERTIYLERSQEAGSEIAEAAIGHCIKTEPDSLRNNDTKSALSIKAALRDRMKMFIVGIVVSMRACRNDKNCDVVYSIEQLKREFGRE